MNSELAALQEKLEETMQKKEKIDQFLINSRGIFRQQVRAEEGEVPGIEIVRRRQKKSEGKKKSLLHILCLAYPVHFFCLLYFLPAIRYLNTWNRALYFFFLNFQP